MALAFPGSPTVGQIYTYSTRSWIWTGDTWDLLTGASVAAGGDLDGTYPNPTIKASVSLTTPILGVASATSINKLAITAPATGATLTVPDGTTVTTPAASVTVRGRVVTVSSGSVGAGSTAGIDYVWLISGAHTITLPTAVSNIARYTFKNYHSASVTIATTSSQTIDGTVGITLGVDEAVDIVSDGSNWRII